MKMIPRYSILDKNNMKEIKFVVFLSQMKNEVWQLILSNCLGNLHLLIQIISDILCFYFVRFEFGFLCICFFCFISIVFWCNQIFQGIIFMFTFSLFRCIVAECSLPEQWKEWRTIDLHNKIINNELWDKK